jgi:hypothetical protein
LRQFVEIGPDFNSEEEKARGDCYGLTVGGPAVATSGGVADVVEALEASGEPVGQTVRWHTVVDSTILARERQDAAADDKQRLRQHTGFQQPFALIKVWRFNLAAMAPRAADVRGAKISTQSITRSAWLCAGRAAPETRVDALSGEARSIALERETENDGDNAGGRQQTLN